MTIARVATSSPDLRQEQLDALHALLPEVFTEGRVDFERLRALLDGDIDAGPERYGLSWAGKSGALRVLQEPSWATLEPDVGQSLDWDTTENALIEGENLDVLKLLYKPYFGRITMIYIDPPYNTGKDFIYPDRFAQERETYLQLTGQMDAVGNLLTSNPESGGRYHSAWLSMMYPRLFLAHQLLREDGVIFVSIDDHELHNLRLLLNQVFGEENFIGQIVLQLNPRGRHLDRFLAKTHEYVLLYAKDATQAALQGVPKGDRMVQEYNREDRHGRYRELELRNRNPMFNSRTRPNLFYPVYVDPENGTVALIPDSSHTVEVLPRNSADEDSCWTWGKERVTTDSHRLVARQTAEGAWRVFRKDYLVSDDGKVATTLPKTIWLDPEINNDYGKKAVQDLFGGHTVFDFPKSPVLVRKMLEMVGDNDAVVMDFFAGSGATAEAVVDMNRADDGHRRFILVQLPETMPEPIRLPDGTVLATIADVARERTRRVLLRAQAESRTSLQFSEQKADLGVRVFQMALSNFRPWEAPSADTDPNEYAEQLALFNDRLVEGWREPDVIWEVALREGFDLSSRVEPVPAVEGLRVWRVTDPDRGQHFFICPDPVVSLDKLQPLDLGREDLFVCRASALDDSTAANLALQCRLEVI